MLEKFLGLGLDDRVGSDDFRKISPTERWSHPARLIQHCYEKKFDSSEVIELISEELEHIAMVPTIMQEMLLWAATGRLLLRLKIRDQTLGIFCLNQYRAMGLRLTSGASDDPLFLRLPARDHEEAEGDPTARANPIDKAN